MTTQVLKLNAAYVPIGVYSWKDAITDWVNGKIEIVEEYDKVLNYGYDRHLDTFKGAMNMPAVVRLTNFVSPKKNLKFYKAFTRRHVWERDQGICQYCGVKVSLKEFTYDHVVPKSQGGPANWKNIVCSCVTCNRKKANRTPEQAGMKLIKKPVAPKTADDYLSGMINKVKAATHMTSNEKWMNYLYWNTEIKDS